MEKNNKGLIILVVILIIMVLSLGGYIVYDKLIDNNKNDVVDKTDDKVDNNEDDNKVVQDTKEESILGDYFGTKIINIDQTHITTEVSMRLIDENNAMLKVSIPEVDVSTYLGTYTKMEDGTLNFSFNKIIWNSGEVTALTPVKNISLKENNKEYTYEMKNSLTSSSDTVLLSKTTSSEVKKDLDDAYQTLNNN
ncbi:unknown [Clostridium sp. CAG:433]|nr:unknown [Clostridium sp. CAG:433]